MVAAKKEQRDKKVSRDRLDKLLQQLKRHFVSSSRNPAERPPNAAAAALGKSIAQEFLVVTVEQGTDNDVLAALCSDGLNPSIPHAFFDSVSLDIVASYEDSSNTTTNSHEWLHHWILKLEDQAVVREPKQQHAARESLLACIRAFAVYLCHKKHNNDDMSLRNTFLRLQLPSSRRTLGREAISAVFALGRVHDVVEVLSPLLAVTVLCGEQESSFVFQFVWRSTWTWWPVWSDHDCRQFLAWMTAALDIFLASPPIDSKGFAAVMDLAESWLLELVLLARDLTEADDTDVQALAHWLDGILSDILPHILVPSFQTAFQTLFDALVELVESLGRPASMDPVLVFRLCGLVMAAPAASDRVALWQLLQSLSPRIPASCSTVTTLLQGLCSIYLQDLDCQASARVVQEMLAVKSCEPNQYAVTPGPSGFSTVLTNSDSGIRDTILTSANFSDTTLSVPQQITALLFGISQLSNGKSYQRNNACKFLHRLFQSYPHLGITMIPTILNQITTTSASKDGQELVQHLEFLCETLVLDSFAAQQVWNLVGVQWMQQHTPVVVRSLLIRLFPKLVLANKRLYRRVQDRLGTCLMDSQAEIRLAAAATLADLAEQDCIRDVSDVIGWIQKLLTEEREQPIHSLIVHYALQCLHYLVVAQELDFDLVIKVLSKCLCPIKDTTKLIELPLVILESLVLLLGDGELAERSDVDDDEGSDSSPKVVAVSRQMTSSVSALVEIGMGLQKKVSGNEVSKKESVVIEQALRNIFGSISRYSFDALQTAVGGMETYQDEKDDTQHGIFCVHYHDLCDLIASGLRSSNGEMVQSEPVVILAQKLVAREEEILGAALWQGQGRTQRKRSSREAKRRSAAALAALPSATKLTSLPAGISPLSRSIATLLASDGSLLTTLRDHADAAIESSDPLLVAFAVKGVLHAAISCHSSSKEGIDSILSSVREWYEIFLSPDAMFLVEASFAVAIAESAGNDEASTGRIKDIYDGVLGAFKSHSFQNEDIAQLSLGLSGMSCLQSGDLDSASEVIVLLEQSVRGYGGRQEFGAFFALALIAQAAEKEIYRNDSSLPTADVARVISRISGFLIEELLSCSDESGGASLSLVACLKGGKATDDLVRSLEGLGSNSVSLLMTKHVVAEFLLISCSLCLPTLAAVDGDLLLAAFRQIEAFEWAGGKGIALAAVLGKCAELKLLSEKELDEIHSEYSSIFQRRLKSNDPEVGADGLDELFYAFNCMSKTPTSHFSLDLIVGNTDLFDDDGCAFSLVACVSAIASVPTLGITAFVEEPLLHANCTAEHVNSVVDIISKAAVCDDGSKYNTMGVVLLGLLSSVKSQAETENDTNTKQTERKLLGDSKNASSRSVAVDFWRLPQPQLGTLSAVLISKLESYHSDETSEFREANAAVMAALEGVSIPRPYSNSVLEVLLYSNTTEKLPALRLLCSQIRGGRRSAIHDGRDFLSLATKIATTAPEAWSRLPREPSELRFILEQLSDILPKFPVDSLESSLGNLWRACSISQARTELTVLFLSGFKHLLQSAVLSPKAVSAIREFLHGRLFADIAAIQLSMGMARLKESPSLVDAYSDCMAELPFAVLEKASFFGLNRPEHLSLTMLRAILSLKASPAGSSPLQRKGQQIKLVTSWLARNLEGPDETVERDNLRRLFCVVAAAMEIEDSTTKRDRLATLFEVLLLTTKETSTAALELIGAVLAYWTGREGALTTSFSYLVILSGNAVEALSIQELDVFFRIVLEELPMNLACFSRKEKLSAVASNELHRLHTHWSECGVRPELLHTLKQAIFCCRETQDHSFQTLASVHLKNSAS